MSTRVTARKRTKTHSAAESMGTKTVTRRSRPEEPWDAMSPANNKHGKALY